MENVPLQLLSPGDIRQLADALGVAPTKKLGQNFVHDAGTLRRIVASAEITPGDHVIEVGPGLGSLTLALLEAGARVSAIELDGALAAALPRTVKDRAPEAASRLRVVNADACAVTGLRDLEAPTANGEVASWEPPTKLVANLPYNVSVPVVLSILASFPTVTSALVMVQKEVGERMAARPGSRVYGAPSVKLAWWGEARVVGGVARTVFWPQPHVDSVLVAFARTPARAWEGLREDVWELVDAAFSQRRKTLRRALAPVCTNAQRVEAICAAAGIDPRWRGEALGVEDFIALARARRGGVSADAPGKVNVLLEVGPARSDGYHPLLTVFEAVSLRERVSIIPDCDAWGVTTCFVDAEGNPAPAPHRWHEVADEDHLALRAARLVADECQAAPGHVEVTKMIPVAGGMAGGSADAAAALVAANKAFDARLDETRLYELARSLGADVPFCLAGGVCVGRERGDVLTPLEVTATHHWVLATSRQGLSTPAVFARFDEKKSASPRDLERELGCDWEEALAEEDPAKLAGLVANDLEEAACELAPHLRAVLDEARRAGALAAMVSGSGPTVAALCAHETQARLVRDRLAAHPHVERALLADGPAAGARVVTR